MIGVHTRRAVTGHTVHYSIIVPPCCGQEKGHATRAFAEFSTIHTPYCYYYR